MPSGLKATSPTRFVCPPSVWTRRPSVARQIRTAPSWLAAATRSPAGLKAMRGTKRVLPRRRATRRPSRVLQTSISWFRPAVATSRPSALTAVGSSSERPDAWDPARSRASRLVPNGSQSCAPRSRPTPRRHQVAAGRESGDGFELERAATGLHGSIAGPSPARRGRLRLWERIRVVQRHLRREARRPGWQLRQERAVFGAPDPRCVLVLVLRWRRGGRRG